MHAAMSLRARHYFDVIWRRFVGQRQAGVCARARNVGRECSVIIVCRLTAENRLEKPFSSKPRIPGTSKRAVFRLPARAILGRY